jgi:Tfp pilus assembly pilus retraction ATPase PilT
MQEDTIAMAAFSIMSGAARSRSSKDNFELDMAYLGAGPRAFSLQRFPAARDRGLVLRVIPVKILTIRDLRAALGARADRRRAPRADPRDGNHRFG